MTNSTTNRQEVKGQYQPVFWLGLGLNFLDIGSYLLKMSRSLGDGEVPPGLERDRTGIRSELAKAVAHLQAASAAAAYIGTPREEIL